MRLYGGFQGTMTLQNLWAFLVIRREFQRNRDVIEDDVVSAVYFECNLNLVVCSRSDIDMLVNASVVGSWERQNPSQAGGPVIAYRELCAKFDRR